jgi:acetyl-CoA acyltransferase
MAVDAAYEAAGVGPQDLDLVELHDCFATAELIHYDNLRLC